MTTHDSERVIILVDMDCFYCQVEEKLNPNLHGKPVAVVQYNTWKGGGIIAVNYLARDRGVTRHMRGDEAKKKCPEIELVTVPVVRGKADLTRYRDAGKEVAEVLQTYANVVERASVDEAYLDITDVVNDRLNLISPLTKTHLPNSHIVGHAIDDFLYNLNNGDLLNIKNLKLAVGGVVVEEIRAAVSERTGYLCSAGIAHNKILAKLACGLHKPNQQTILLQESVQELYKTLPVHKIKNLGGKLGHSLSEELGVKTMGDLLKFTEKDLKKSFDEKTAVWLYNIARGIDFEPVNTRLISKSIGCCKKFPGITALTSDNEVQHWLSELAIELFERLEKDNKENNRRAKHIIVGFEHTVKNQDISASRTHCLNSYDLNKIKQGAYDIITKNCLRSDGSYHIKFLGLSAGKFENNKHINEITSFFKPGPSTSTATVIKENRTTNTQEDVFEIFFRKRTASTTTTNSTKTPIDLSIFFEETLEQIYDEDVLNKYKLLPALKTYQNDTSSDADSITEELLVVNKQTINCPLDNGAKSKSFFQHFFENNKKGKCQSPVDRNFDTSLHLENDYEQQPEVDNNAVPNTTEICKDCNKQISIDEIVLHADYHFALRVMKEESNMHKTVPVKSPEKKTSPIKKSLKRKPPDNQNTLHSFLVNHDATNSAICSECIEGTCDYHYAKKLHLELNSLKKSKNDINISKVPVLTSYFKKL